MTAGIASRAKGFALACLRGAAQVMLCPRALTGVLMLAGVALASRTAVPVAALIALVAATAVGRNREGLSGFNALLVGCAAFTFLSTGAATWALMVAAALLTLPLKRGLDILLSPLKVSSYTLPFIFATWIMLSTAPLAGITPFTPEDIPPEAALTALNLLKALLLGISQVFLIDSPLAGLQMLCGLWISDRRFALWALVGSATGMAVAAALGCGWQEIAAGLWGFSPVLTAIALCSCSRPWVTVSAIIATVIIQLLLSWPLTAIGLPVLTMPFCLATITTRLLTRDRPRMPM